MNCKKCKDFSWYDLANASGDMLPFDPTKVDRNHCGWFLAGGRKKSRCPIERSVRYRLWVWILWHVGYYPRGASKETNDYFAEMAKRDKNESKKN
jgi:hypothetical protein